jgi:ribonucrease Y
MISLIVGIIGLVAGVGLGYVLRKSVAKKQIDTAEARVTQMLQDAKSKEKEILVDAKEKSAEMKLRSEAEEKQIQARLLEAREKLEKREEKFFQKIEELEDKREQLRDKAKHIQSVQAEVEQIKQQQIEELGKVAGLEREQAREMVLDRVEKDMNEDLLARMKKLREKTDEELEKEARQILSTAIDRVAAVHSADTTATVVTLPNDEMKGRIIGREGRNIKVLEQLTGVEVVVDDTPGAVVISGFNPVRRHVAKVALESLMRDGRIHPAKIEEAVKDAKEKIAHEIHKSGEEALYELGLPSAEFDPKLVQLLGRLKFRTSYGQNVLRHSAEAAHVAGILAEEIGADVKVCKVGALFHDIGKGVDHEIKGTHTEIGVNIGKKFGLSEPVIHVIAAHHEDIPAETVEALIVRAADAISASRVGARSDTYEDYIRRLEDLEHIANAFEGVEKSYAIQAGREVRIFVTPTAIDDVGAVKLARNVAKRVEEELQYPGEIKISVIRETRAIEFAR